MTSLICGVLGLDGRRADPGAVSAMLDAMQPAGLPAARAMAEDGPVALGVLALAPSGGAAPERPAILPLGDGLLAADVRLYGETGPDPDPARSLAEALSIGGPDAPAALDGDFAYAAWDGGTGRLTLARDHFGVRPLYWCLRPGRHFAFASLVPALLGAGLADRALDARMVASYPVNLDATGDRTLHRAVRVLEPAHRLNIGTDGAPRIARYWRLDISRRLPLDSDPDELAAEMLRLLDRAVHRRLPATGPVAGQMSGGLDSSSVAVLAARALGPQGRRYRAQCFVETPSDGPEQPGEGRFAAATAASAPNIDLVPLPPPPVGPGSYETLPGEAIRADPAHAVNASLRLASGQGIGVMLSGWGGDQMVTWSGHGAMAELFWRGRWPRLRRELRRAAALTGIAPARLFLSVVAIESLPHRLAARLRLWAGRPDHGLRFVAAQASAIVPHRRGDVREETIREHIGTHALRRAQVEHAWVSRRMAQEARQAADAGMAFSYPMLDRVLVEFAISIPGILCRHDALPRAIFRRAMAGLLPDEVRLNRTKLVPYPCGFLRLVEGRDAILGLLREAGASALVRDYIDIDAVLGQVASWPSADALRRRIAASASAGEVFPDGDIELVLLLARFLQDAEAAANPMRCAPPAPAAALRTGTG